MRVLVQWRFRAAGLVIALALVLLLGVYQWSRDAELRRERQASAALVGSLGITVRPLDRKLAEELNVLPNVSGLVVTSIADGKPAARAGMRPGDVIEEVDGFAVVDTRSMAFALSRESRTGLVITANRGPRELIFRVPRA